MRNHFVYYYVVHPLILCTEKLLICLHHETSHTLHWKVGKSNLNNAFHTKKRKVLQKKLSRVMLAAARSRSKAT